VNLIGLEGEGIKEIAEAARIEDRNHFEALVPRIYELGGELPQNMKESHDMSACPPASLPSDPTDIEAMLTVLVEAERCAVRGYTHICKRKSSTNRGSPSSWVRGRPVTSCVETYPAVSCGRMAGIKCCILRV
jgi:ferritin-like protein